MECDTKERGALSRPFNSVNTKIGGGKVKVAEKRNLKREVQKKYQEALSSTPRKQNIKRVHI